MELADKEESKSRPELLGKLSATHALSKSTMWDLRHAIKLVAIYEGREQASALRAHASTFTTCE